MKKFGQHMEVHSWPRRSEKTGAAIMIAAQRGWKYYNCGGIEWTRRQFNGIINPDIILQSLIGQNKVVVDNYDVATEKDKQIISTMTDVEVFGTLGPIDGDYKMPSKEMWKCAIEAVDEGIYSIETALVDFNLVPKGYFNR